MRNLQLLQNIAVCLPKCLDNPSAYPLCLLLCTVPLLLEFGVLESNPESLISESDVRKKTLPEQEYHVSFPLSITLRIYSGTVALGTV